MNTFCIPFFQELERDFELLKSTYSNIIEHSQKMIFFLEKKLKQINKWVKTFCFDNEKDEIYFFKELKPSLVSKILYYKYILKIESTLPPGKKGKRKHYIKALNKATLSGKENRDFYEYYRSRATYNDTNYFIRRPYKDIIRDHSMLLFFDSKISTSHDYQVANLISADMLINYLERKIDEIDNKSGTNNYGQQINYSWSGTKIDLVELIYALKHAKLINNGNTDVKELATHIGKIFNMELEDSIYRIYQDIKIRKTVRTKFLNSLADNLNQKLLEEDS
ncbi:RteC domain-containing protein [Hwangdonia seohaensis]|uniref:RteC domain-containing protein n=1 Tax=Hwangdonia seohaensis TaxID=1240727 RepID=A0ABW3RAT7_9FLAO|nr:RteC domain-containing protein [Hwangdonia seohaensis]